MNIGDEGVAGVVRELLSATHLCTEMSIKYALTKQKKKSNTVPIQQGQCDI